MDLIAGYGGDDEPAPEPTPGVEIDGAEAKQTPDAAPVLTVDIPADMLAGFDDIRSKMMVNLAPVVKEKENVRIPTTKQNNTVEAGLSALLRASPFFWVKTNTQLLFLTFISHIDQ